jgi:hypothetical protein
MPNYSAKTIKELKALAKDRDIDRYSMKSKEELVIALEALDAEGDPANFADLPDEIAPAPEPEEASFETPVEEAPPAPPIPDPVPTPPATLIPPPEPERFKLMNDVRFMKKDGVSVRLKAGRILKSNEYDLDRVRACGGVLTSVGA